jgi:hypothetical protein
VPRIDGVLIHRLVTLEDKRGEIVEIYRPSWNLHPDPMVYAYQVIVRPGAIKGWEVHRHQDDRVYISSGVVRWALFDHRSQSPTYKLLNVFTFQWRAYAPLNDLPQERYWLAMHADPSELHQRVFREAFLVLAQSGPWICPSVQR